MGQKSCLGKIKLLKPIHLGESTVRYYYKVILNFLVFTMWSTLLIDLVSMSNQSHDKWKMFCKNVPRTMPFKMQAFYYLILSE
jgi:hypothetical protein